MPLDHQSTERKKGLYCPFLFLKGRNDVNDRLMVKGGRRRLNGNRGTALEKNNN
jgi:hypothetical protein